MNENFDFIGRLEGTEFGVAQLVSRNGLMFVIDEWGSEYEVGREQVQTWEDFGFIW